MSELPGDEWIDVSCVGDPWEVNFNLNVRDDADRRRTWRYRSACLGVFRTEWAYGRPPSGAHGQ